MMRFSCLLLGLAACGLAACGSAAPRIQRLPTAVLQANAELEVHDVWISTPTAVADSEGSGLASIRSTVQIAVRLPFDCGPEAFAIAEHEGSNQGSYGIDRAVTYYEPRVTRSRCAPAAAPREYILTRVWTRWSGTPWTIVVASYTGTTDRVPGTALYAKALANHVERRPAREHAIEVGGSFESLTNAPEISRVDVRRDGTDLLVTLDLEYGTECFATWMPWHLAARSVRSGDHTFIWAVMERGAITDGVTCGEAYAPISVRAVYRIPVSGAKVSIAIPNVAGRDELPIYRKSL